ncbi:DUF2894 domain-containing protein [soil metagenome]
MADEANLGSGAASAQATSEIAATLAAWRERGDHRFDPVRFHFIEAMARRAAAHGGAPRRLLDEKLLGLVAAYGDALGNAAPADGHRPSHSPAERRAADRGAAEPRPKLSGPLAELVDHLARLALPHRDDAAAKPVVPASFVATELKSLEYFRSTWSRLSTERRLTQSLAKVPDKAGPLNSHHLVHRALTTMRELSPAYLTHFMAHVDALLWLDQVNIASSAAADPPRADNPRKSARSPR